MFGLNGYKWFFFLKFIVCLYILNILKFFIKGYRVWFLHLEVEMVIIDLWLDFIYDKCKYFVKNKDNFDIFKNFN